MPYDTYDFSKIVLPLLQWYDKNKRDLPWRQSQNPYHIWISEIMLQQTRVEAVKPYYARFLEALPTVEALAMAEEGVLLKLWEGLGYYSRVRNMKVAAQEVMERHAGQLPADYHQLLKLKGIGPYTAGAIASIAFSLPSPAIDGNVLRVMSRLSKDENDISLPKTKKIWEEVLLEIIPTNQPGAFNQGLMELGATVCLPNGAPKCMACPLRSFCQAYQYDVIAQYPVKAQKKARVVEHRQVFFVTTGEKIAIQKRPAKGLLSSLWELPNVLSAEGAQAPFPELLQHWGITIADITPMTEQKHIFTHIEWHMECFYVKATALTQNTAGLTWATPTEIEAHHALPSAFKKIYAEGVSMNGEGK